MDNNYSYNDEIEEKREVLQLKIVKLLYALVMFGSAALIYILFENIISLSIYLVYLSLGIIFGLAVIIVLHVVLAPSNKIPEQYKQNS